MKSQMLYRKSSGFTLIEILIALVVAGIGIMATIQLYALFLGSVSVSKARSTAFNLADKKIEELRGFQAISSADPSVLDYEEIISHKDQPTINGIQYTVSTSVISYLVSGSTFSVPSDKSDIKELTVAVYWDQSDCNLAAPGENCVVVQTRIASIDPSLTALAGNPSTQVAGTEALVSHAVGSVPDVIPIDLGNGSTRETALPLPETTNKSISTEVLVLTVNYDSSTNQQIKEDFLTVNCFCQLETATQENLTPHHYIYDAAKDRLKVRAGIAAETQYTGSVYDPGGNFPGQSAYCDRCCAGHHDPNNVTLDTGKSLYQEYPGYKQGVHDASSGPHPHYTFNTATGVVSGVAGVGDPYLEACRFRRVDGLYKLFTDWRLIDLSAFSLAYGNSTSNVETYQQYVKDRLRDAVFSTSSAAFNTEQYSALPNSYNQILARGIYLDDMSYDPAWVARRDAIAASVAWKSQTSPDWLGFVPFNEINTTLLAEWPSGYDTSLVTQVTDEEVEDVDPDDPYAVGADGIPGNQDDDGYYSRGNAQTSPTASTGGTTPITTETKMDNTGLLGNRYGIGATGYVGNDNAIVPSMTDLSAAVQLSISSGSNIRVLVTEVGQVNLNKVTITYTHGGGAEVSCPLQSVDPSKTLGTYNCDVSSLSAGDTLVVSATTSQNGEQVVPSSKIATVGTDFQVDFTLQDVP